jgi:phosphoesterase RecJ-like protein
MFNDKYKKAYKRIKEANNILLLTHHKPDGDALSSSCGMIEILLSLNKKFFAYCHDLPPSQFNFLPNIDLIDNDKNQVDMVNRDLIIIMDCGQIGRAKLDEDFNNIKPEQTIIEFDHHPKIENVPSIELRFPELSSTAEVLYDFCKSNHIIIKKNLANCILTGILTDTGNLLFPCTTDKSIKIASKMLTYGARFPLILEGTWRNKSLNGMRMWGAAMSNLFINKKYNLAVSILTRQEIEGCGATDEEFEGIAGYLSTIHGAKGLLFLREEADGLLKGSLRGMHQQVDISRLARVLGGGGHPKSSGFRLLGHIKEQNNKWLVE